MSYLLEMLGRGLPGELGDWLDRYFWAPQTRSIEQLCDDCRRNGDDPQTHFRLGVACLRAVQLDEAVEHLREAIRRRPDFLAARLALASAWVEQGRVAEALDQLVTANNIRGGEVPILYAIGFCRERLGEPDKATEYYHDAVERDGTFVPARQRLAAIAVYRDNVPEAIAQYETLKELLPGEVWVDSTLAHLYYRNGRPAQAVEAFEMAIAMEPDNWSLVDDEVEALVAAGNLAEAIERLESLLEQQGEFADLHVRLADLLSKTGDDAGAVSHYLTALEIQPNYLEADVKFGTHHLVHGRWEQACEHFCHAAELNEKLLVNYVGMGVAQLAAGERQKAMDSFDLAAAVEPNSSLLLAEMARLQMKTVVADDFCRSFETSDQPPVVDLECDQDELIHHQMARHAEEVARHPNHADLRYRYGVLLRAEGRLGEALDEFAKAVELNPAYVQAIIKLAVTHQDLGHIDEAIKAFKQALELKPDYVDLHYRLGLLYTDRREFAQAVEEMARAADGSPDNEQIRAGLALSLQNMGLMDQAAATWRSLWKLHQPKTQ